MGYVLFSKRMCIVAYITFKEVKVEAQSLLKENKHSLRRNFPNVVYKHLRLLSLLALPESPALAFPEQWMGWRDLLGPDYFSNPIRKSPVDSNMNLISLKTVRFLYIQSNNVCDDFGLSTHS
jgi:hypothetical protein